jgi:hypothetical protein
MLQCQSIPISCPIPAQSARRRIHAGDEGMINWESMCALIPSDILPMKKYLFMRKEMPISVIDLNEAIE